DRQKLGQLLGIEVRVDLVGSLGFADNLSDEYTELVEARTNSRPHWLTQAGLLEGQLAQHALGADVSLGNILANPLVKVPQPRERTLVPIAGERADPLALVGRRLFDHSDA